MKENITPDKMQDAAEALKGIANERRLHILCTLVDGAKNVSELQEETGISQSNLSQHLAKMRNLGVLNCVRDGKQIYYSISHSSYKKVVKALQEVFCPRD